MQNKLSKIVLIALLNVSKYMIRTKYIHEHLVSPALYRLTSVTAVEKNRCNKLHSTTRQIKFSTNKNQINSRNNIIYYCQHKMPVSQNLFRVTDKGSVIVYNINFSIMKCFLKASWGSDAQILEITGLYKVLLIYWEIHFIRTVLGVY